MHLAHRIHHYRWKGLKIPLLDAIDRVEPNDLDDCWLRLSEVKSLCKKAAMRDSPQYYQTALVEIAKDMKWLPVPLIDRWKMLVQEPYLESNYMAKLVSFRVVGQIIDQFIKRSKKDPDLRAQFCELFHWVYHLDPKHSMGAGEAVYINVSPSTLYHCLMLEIPPYFKETAAAILLIASQKQRYVERAQTFLLSSLGREDLSETQGVYLMGLFIRNEKVCEPVMEALGKRHPKYLVKQSLWDAMRAQVAANIAIFEQAELGKFRKPVINYAKKVLENVQFVRASKVLQGSLS